MKLLIMACSAAKRPEAGLLPAIDRYDGPMWQTLRTTLAALPAARSAIGRDDLRIMVLSAAHGFIPATCEIADYDQRMTPDRMAAIIAEPRYGAAAIRQLLADAEAALFAGGLLYRNAMWRASGGSLWNLMKTDETDGAGIGFQRAQLAAWLNRHFSIAAEQEAAA